MGGSPTLVINDVVVSTARDPKSLLDAICTGFKEKPEECSQEVSTSAYNPGFGFTVAAPSQDAAAAGSCG